MQLAMTNVGQTTFGQAKDEEMVRETVDEEEAISSQHSAFSESETPTTETRRHGGEKSQIQTFETQRNGGSGGEQGLLRTDADPRRAGTGGGGSERVHPVEWKPTADMYRMDTPEGRAAYEASFGAKVEPGSSGERRPAQTVTAPEEHAETYAVMG
jgi:hypothetical protein